MIKSFYEKKLEKIETHRKQRCSKKWRTLTWKNVRENFPIVQKIRGLFLAANVSIYRKVRNIFPFFQRKWENFGKNRSFFGIFCVRFHSLNTDHKPSLIHKLRVIRPIFPIN